MQYRKSEENLLNTYVSQLQALLILVCGTYYRLVKRTRRFSISSEIQEKRGYWLGRGAGVHIYERTVHRFRMR